MKIGTVEAVLVGAMLLTSAPAVPGARQSGIAPAQTTSTQPAAGDHRYRVIGRIRFLLFWTGRQELGSGRLNWRLGGPMDTDTIALLAGSNPQSAPRGINEWGYLRERVEGDRTVVFSVRTLTQDSLEQADAGLAEGSGPELFGALCSTVTSRVVRSTMTNVRAGPGVTYRDFSHLLDIFGRATRWTFRDVPAPPGAAPGLLTALQRLLRDSVVASRASVRGSGRSLPYIYGRTTYDLQLQESEPIDEFRIGSQAFHDVMRSRFSIRNRTTNVETAFVMTYGTTGRLAGVPIHAAYQPHWWLKVELALDDMIDVPPDPAGDERLLERMGAVCPARGDANR